MVLICKIFQIFPNSFFFLYSQDVYKRQIQFIPLRPNLGDVGACVSASSCHLGQDHAKGGGDAVSYTHLSWCSSSNANDQRAVTIECASDTYHPYAMNSKVYNTDFDSETA